MPVGRPDLAQWPWQPLWWLRGVGEQFADVRVHRRLDPNTLQFLYGVPFHVLNTLWTGY